MLAGKCCAGAGACAALALLPVILAGCAGEQKKLYISSDTILGLDASVNTVRESGSVRIGYDRYFLTWVPQSVPDEQDPDAREVMSALNCTRVTIGDLVLKEFQESLATGRAAREFIQNADTQHKYFACFDGGSK